jgi:hypothetical protein
MDHDEQLTALRGLYEGLSLEHDDVQRELVRVSAQLGEARRKLAVVEARAEAAELEADQLAGSDRAVRQLVVREEALTAIGEGSGAVPVEALRLAIDKGETGQVGSNPVVTRLRAAGGLEASSGRGATS